MAPSNSGNNRRSGVMAARLRRCNHWLAKLLTRLSDRGSASITGDRPWEFDGKGSSGDLEMHGALIRSIREGRPINEGVRLAEATMTGVMGRMSAYTGRALKWDWAMNASKLDLRPAKYEMGPLPVEPVAMPGRTPLV